MTTATQAAVQAEPAAAPALLIMLDDSNPPGPLPPSDAVAGYVGCRGWTPHVWTPQQWAAQGRRPRLPIWVPNQNISAVENAAQLVMALKRLGVPAGSPVAWDMEMRVDPDFVDVATEHIGLHGYWAVVYNSLSVAADNPQRGGRWVADYSLTPAQIFAAVPGVVAAQYQSGPDYDTSVLSRLFYTRLWRP